jgi:hypothetical protein
MARGNSQAFSLLNFKSSSSTSFIAIAWILYAAAGFQDSTMQEINTGVGRGFPRCQLCIELTIAAEDNQVSEGTHT